MSTALSVLALLGLLSTAALLRPLSALSLSTSLVRLEALARLPSLASLSSLCSLPVLGPAAVTLGLLLAPVCALGSLVRLPARLSLAADVALRSSLIARRLTGLLVAALILLAASRVVVLVVSHGLS